MGMQYTEELVLRLLDVADGQPVQMIHCSDALQNALDQCDPKRQIARYSGSPTVTA